jgi:hypothetical protein
VVEVSFAPGNGWFGLKQGGGAEWSGLPESLVEYLEQYCKNYDGIEALSVGHNGEWFVKFEGGHYASCGVHPALADLLEKKQQQDWCSGVGGAGAGWHLCGTV